jgi:hypothetical protein
LAPPSTLPGRWVLVRSRFNGVEQPLARADTFFLGSDSRLRVSVNNGLCGISAPGAYRVSDPSIYIDVRLDAYPSMCYVIFWKDTLRMEGGALVRRQQFQNGQSEDHYERR